MLNKNEGWVGCGCEECRKQGSILKQAEPVMLKIISDLKLDGNDVKAYFIQTLLYIIRLASYSHNWQTIIDGLNQIIDFWKHYILTTEIGSAVRLGILEVVRSFFLSTNIMTLAPGVTVEDVLEEVKNEMKKNNGKKGGGFPLN